MSETGVIMDNLLDEKKFHSIKSTLVSNDGQAYHDFKKTLKPRYEKIVFDIALGWFGIIACVLAALGINEITHTWIKLILSFLDAALLGFIVNYLSNFFHEAAHYNLTRSKNKNDLFANIFLGILQAQHIKHYRLVHWQHHVQHGTPEDTEHSYFNSLNTRFIIESLTGIRAIRIFLFRANNTKVAMNKEEARSIKKQKLQMLFTGAIFHLITLCLFIITAQYWAAAIWLVGFGTFFPFFGALRQLLEHRSEDASKKTNYSKVAHGRTNRIFSGNRFAATFGSAGFDRHLLHHLEPQISYTNLKDLEKYLDNTSLAPQLKKQKTSYFKVFISLLGK